MSLEPFTTIFFVFLLCGSLVLGELLGPAKLGHIYVAKTLHFGSSTVNNVCCPLLPNLGRY